MPEPIRRGQENEPLPSGLTVLRFWGVAGLNDEALRLVAEGKGQPTMFAFSDAERAQPIKSLSVWAEAVTAPPVAWRLSGAKPNSRVLMRLTSDAIRQVEV